MGMTIEDIKHCLLTMIDCEVCEECNLYGTTGTDHCEHDCVDGALHIMCKYQKIQEILKDIPYGGEATVRRIQEVLEDGDDERQKED